MIDRIKKGKLLFLSDEDLAEIQMSQGDRQVVECFRRFLKNDKNPLMLVA